MGAAILEERGGTFPRSVGEAFLLLRRRAGLTQQELAARAGVSVGAIARAESGWGLPQPPEKAVKVLEVLGASTEQFVNLVDALWKTSEERFAADEGEKAAERAAGEEAVRSTDGVRRLEAVPVQRPGEKGKVQRHDETGCGQAG